METERLLAEHHRARPVFPRPLPPTEVPAEGVQSEFGSATTLSVALIASADGRVYAFTLSATVESEAQTPAYQPEGSITFKDGPTVLGTFPLIGDKASLATGILPPGTHNFTATFSGGGGYSASSSNVVQAISQAVPPTLVAAERGPIRGRSTIALTFSEPMSFMSLHNAANYQVVPFRMLRNRRTVFGRPLRVRSAQVSASTESVTLVLAQRLSPHLSYQLTVRGTPPGGVANAGGTLLNGNGSGTPGTNAVIVLAPLPPTRAAAPGRR